MNHKKILGLVVAIVGVVLIFFGVRSMNTIREAKNELQNMYKGMSHDVVGKKVNGSMMMSASQYDTEVKIVLYSGILLVLVGGGLFFLHKHKKKR
jgi:uncharacterized membrane protein